jgi:hypothetical protein
MLQRILFLLLLMIMIVGGEPLYCQQSAKKAQEQPSLYTPRIIESDAEKIIIEITPPPLSVLSAGIKESDGQFASLPGYSLTATPGKPQLPLRGFIIGVPDDANPTVTLLDVQDERHLLDNVPPAPSIKYEKRLAEDGMSLAVDNGSTFVYEKDKSVYAKNEFYPASPVALSEAAIMRGRRLLPVQIYPVLYNPVSGQVRYHSRIRFAVYFNAPTQLGKTSSTETADKHFEPLFQSTVLNYEQSKNWSTSTSKNLKKTSNKTGYFLDEGSEWYKIFTDKPGIFTVSKSALDASGLNTASIDPRNIKMFNRGVEVAIRVDGESDGSFDSDDYIEFYADAFKNYYTETNIYWLTVASSSGKRMQVVDGSITGSNPILTRGKALYHYEKDVGHRADYPGHTDNTKWWLTAVIAPETETHTLDLGFVSDTTASDCSFLLKGQGMTGTDTDPDHHTIVEINDNQLFDETWDGRNIYLKKSSFPQSWLAEGDNNFVLIGPGDTGSSIDYLYIDYLEIEYWKDYIATNDSILFPASGSGIHSIHMSGFSDGAAISIFDISDSTNVKLVNNFQQTLEFLRFQNDVTSGKQFLAVGSLKKNQPLQIVKDNYSSLRATNNRADYIVIAHPDFAGPAQRLADYREAQGLAAQMITTTDAYDEFNNGFYDASALKNLFEYAYDNWSSPKPSYVVLIGDASWNPKIFNTGFYGDEQSDYVPTRFFEAHEDNFEAASDSWFGQIEGNDVLPEIFIGRLSARTIDHAEAQVNKIINYETDFEAGLWNRTATFCADNGEGGVLAFEDSSDAFIDDLVPKSFHVNRVYLEQLGTAGARSATMSAFDEGTLMVNFYGHGSSKAWAAEDFFNRDDVADLRNDNKAPFVVTLSCINGYFVNPKDSDKCFGETLERERQRGSIGVLTGSGEAYPSPVLTLGRKIWGSLFQDQNKRLGPLTNAGIVEMLSRYPDMTDHAQFYILFGDPATKLHYQPSVNFTAGGFEGAVTTSGSAPAIGSVLHAILDFKIVKKMIISDVKGAFGPLYINADNPLTDIKDGAVAGDSIHFELVTTSKDTVPLYPYVVWKSGEVQNTTLSNFKTGIESALDIVLYVDGKKVGDGVYDGDILSQSSIISAQLSSRTRFINPSTIRVELNGEELQAGDYALVLDKNDPHHLAHLQFQADVLGDGDYELKVEAIDPASLLSSSQESFSFSIQSELQLSKVVNYPNPMKRDTKFTFLFANDKAGDVTIKIYTVAGRLIKSIIAAAQVGYNEIPWDGADAYGDTLANGVYFYRISAGDGEEKDNVIERLVVMN